MKYLSNYIEAAQTELFNRLGVFFAFGNKQFDEQKKEGVKYVSLGAGLICPVEHAKTFWAEHKKIVDAGIALDLAENGKTGVIDRELDNHECLYTGDITDCVMALKNYPITADEIKAIYYEKRKQESEAIS